MDRFKGESMPAVIPAAISTPLSPSLFARVILSRFAIGTTTPAPRNHTNLTIGTAGEMLRNDRGVRGLLLTCLSRIKPGAKTVRHIQRLVLV